MKPVPLNLPASGPLTHRWTRDEYLRLNGLGWFAGPWVELVGGRIIHTPTRKNPHAFAVTRTHKALEASFSPSFRSARR